MDNPISVKEIIAIIGGTGKEGQGLAYRWAKTGYPVIIGSRNREKAESAKAAVIEMLSSSGVKDFSLEADENEQAVHFCNIAVLTIPYEFHDETLLNLKNALIGKFLVDVTVPLVPPKVSIITIPPDGSLGLHTQRILGSEVKVITAFQNISFELLMKDEPVHCDVLVCGVDKVSRETGLRLVEDAGLTGWDAGPLENSIISEGLTSVLIRINKQFGTHSAGIKITGVPQGR
ncbi:MAG: NADPH-dependent F420 reductase [Chloroflexi bacterium]|nr:NADPH-dependent F420 reductase [Chloroflexota bacterium]